MSQYTQPLIALPRRVGARRAVMAAAVLAFAAAVAVVLVLAIDSGSSPAVSVGGKAAPVRHSGGGAGARDGFATAVSSQSVLSAGTAGGPDESRVAASLSAGTAPAGGPDESRVAASIAGH